jgi:hypothetical protein
MAERLIVNEGFKIGADQYRQGQRFVSNDEALVSKLIGEGKIIRKEFRALKGEKPLPKPVPRKFAPATQESKLAESTFERSEVTDTDEEPKRIPGRSRKTAD